MGVFGNLWGKLRRSLENPNLPLNDPSAWEEAGFFEGKSDAGVKVSKRSALGLAAVWQAVDLISGDVAKLPLEVFRRVEDDGREADTAHPAYRLVRREPNREMDHFFFWRLVMVHALLYRNAYIWIDRNGRGEPIELLPLLPDRTAPVRMGGKKYFETVVNGKVEPLPASDVLHIAGFSLDGLAGCDLVKAAKEAIGVGLARQKFGARFFKNGARVSGVLQAPPGSKKENRDKVAAGVEKAHQGLDNAFKVLVLRDNYRFVQTSIAPNEAQMVESMGATVKDVARYFNLPPHKLADSTNASHNSLEQENQSYLDSSLSPWLTAITAQCHMKLLTPAEREADSHYFEHNTAALLRGDTETRYKVYSIAIDKGILSPDEVRSKENLNKRPDGQGGVYLRPLNMAPADDAEGDEPAGDPPPPPDPPDEESARQLRQALSELAEDAIGRVVKRLTLHARKAAKRGDWQAWLEEFGGEHRDVCERMLAPVAAAAVAITGVRAEVYESLCVAIRGDLANRTAEARDLAAVVELVCADYETKAARVFARRYLATEETQP